MKHLRTLAEGLGRYLGWWLNALVRWRDPLAPMTLRRAAVLLLGMPLFLLVQLIHAVCLLLDELLFPGYRKVVIKQPLFVTGIPRSGTTFLHRTLAVDHERYTTLTTWEALLAPSIVQRKIIHALAWLDQCLGGPGQRGVNALTRRLAGGLDDIHEVGLEAAEEDYLALLPVAGCFIMLLAFPAALGLQQLGHLDQQMPPARRKRLLSFYYSCLQRHLYVDGGQRRLLSKNAAFGSWLEGLYALCPDGRFIICAREPLAALNSQISSIESAHALFGSAVNADAFQQLFADQFADTLDHMTKILARWPIRRAAVVDMADLGAAPGEVIPAVLEQLEVEASERLKTHLLALPKRPHRPRANSGDTLVLPRSVLEQRLLPLYYQLIALPHRKRITP